MRLRLAALLSLLCLPALAQVELPSAQPMAPPSQPVQSEGPVTADSLEEELSSLDAAIARRAHVLYRLQRAGMLPVAGGFESMLSHLGRIQRLERMLQNDVQHRRAVRQRHTEIQAAEAAAAEAAATEAARIAAAEAALPPDHGLNTFFDPNYTPRLSVAPVPRQPYGLRLRGRPARSFQQQRGSLPMPVQGGGTIRDASREDGRGLEFAAPSSTVKAVAEGTVAFARRYGRYGSMVVVDHGQSFFTVYAGLARMDVAVGDRLYAQQAIGQTEESLYFEVRRGSRSLDPRSWFGL